MPDSSDYRSFRKLGIATVVAVYFLILVGGIVRSTGAGMGCPDWPKCFGNWIPPTQIGQLPVNYKDVYAQKRKIKNERIASYLMILKLDTLARKVLGDNSVYEELDFNPVKTWIEYLNRLVGVVIGILIFLLLIFSYKFISVDKSIFWLSLTSFFMVGLEGWLGSIVVSTNLLPFAITLHMALAIFLVGILIYITVRSDIKNFTNAESGNLKIIEIISIICIICSFIQLLAGTQVREQIDAISDTFNNVHRELWIGKLGGIFTFHRSFSIIIVITNIYLVYLIKKIIKPGNLLYGMASVLTALILSEVVLGIVMAYLSIPSFTQPLHLVVGSLLVGVQMYLFFYLIHNRQTKRLNLSVG